MANIIALSTAQHLHTSYESTVRWGFLDAPHDHALASKALKRGAVVAHGFGQFYALSTRPDASTVGQMNQWKGRPFDQVGSISTTPLLIPSLFDWSKVPDENARPRVLALMDALLALGPFGFRGPAHEDIPRHLSSNDGETRTTQVIVPGYRCPSQALISACIHQIEERFIYVTSANQSHHRTGRTEEPAHWKAAPLAADFEHVDELFVMTHRDEERARELHPDHLPMSTSILSFHRRGLEREPIVRLERLGSMGSETIRELVHGHGFKLEVAPSAESRLPCRRYSAEQLN